MYTRRDFDPNFNEKQKLERLADKLLTAKKRPEASAQKNLMRLKGFIGSRGVATGGLSLYDMISVASKLFDITPRPLADMVEAIDALGVKKRRKASRENRKDMPATLFSSGGSGSRKEKV